MELRQVHSWLGRQGRSSGEEIQRFEDFVHGCTYAVEHRDARDQSEQREFRDYFMNP